MILAANLIRIILGITASQDDVALKESWYRSSTPEAPQGTSSSFPQQGWKIINRYLGCSPQSQRRINQLTSRNSNAAEGSKSRAFPVHVGEIGSERKLPADVQHPRLLHLIKSHSSTSEPWIVNAGRKDPHWRRGRGTYRPVDRSRFGPISELTRANVTPILPNAKLLLERGSVNTVFKTLSCHRLSLSFPHSSRLVGENTLLPRGQHKASRISYREPRMPLQQL